MKPLSLLLAFIFCLQNSVLFSEKSSSLAPKSVAQNASPFFEPTPRDSLSYVDYVTLLFEGIEEIRGIDKEVLRKSLKGLNANGLEKLESLWRLHWISTHREFQLSNELKEKTEREIKYLFQINREQWMKKMGSISQEEAKLIHFAASITGDKSVKDAAFDMILASYVVKRNKQGLNYLKRLFLFLRAKWYIAKLTINPAIEEFLGRSSPLLFISAIGIAIVNSQNKVKPILVLMINILGVYGFFSLVVLVWLMMIYSENLSRLIFSTNPFRERKDEELVVALKKQGMDEEVKEIVQLMFHLEYLFDDKILLEVGESRYSELKYRPGGLISIEDKYFYPNAGESWDLKLRDERVLKLIEERLASNSQFLMSASLEILNYRIKKINLRRSLENSFQPSLPAVDTSL